MGAFEFAPGPTLHTDRMRLRPWRPGDLEAFAALNADPRVMRWFPRPLTRDESDAVAARIQNGFRTEGFGFWALETDAVPFGGFVGLQRPAYEADFLPAIEIGWRLDPRLWGQGLATEAARAALAHGFGTADLEQIIAVAPRANVASLAVMARLGMSCDPAEDFDHPALTDHPEIRRCALHRLSRSSFVWPAAA